ncbi:amiloride-sensitive sodium channel [Desmophyllum pertusum]|uniref:Amiloride-sensitive sodium channel n=1 Tax=Desmophyllum pertusum TaxID=174260 RepID=A0A9X0CX93_9CNID|nr:amiloride-sensitive sodium channel [Desmophyllum pertusum]
MEDTYNFGGHQINKTMKTCTWSGEKCDDRNFTRNLTSMGLCHTFNSGNDGRDILRVKNAGSKFGLNLVLDVQQLTGAYKFFS